MRVVNWLMVAPRVDRELEALKTRLTTAPLAEVQEVQARYQALFQVKRWFEVAATDEPIFDSST